MFSLETYIDTFQHTKRQVSNQVITDPVCNKAANDFIDAQTIFAKMLLKNTKELTAYFIDSQTSFWFPKDKK